MTLEFEIKLFLLSHRHITHMEQNWSAVYNISECLNSNNNANLSGLNSTKHMTTDHNNVQIKLRLKFNKRSAVKQEDFLRVVSMNSISNFHISHITSSMIYLQTMAISAHEWTLTVIDKPFSSKALFDFFFS